MFSDGKIAILRNFELLFFRADDSHNFCSRKKKKQTGQKMFFVTLGSLITAHARNHLA